MVVFLFHIASAVVLFFLVNWIGRLSSGYLQLTIFVRKDEAPAFNFLFRVLAPTVYIIVLGTVLYSLQLDYLVHNFYLVVIYYVLFRLAFNIAMERASLLNWPVEILRSAVIIGLAFTVYERILYSRKNVLIDISTFTNEMWILIVIFLYQTFNNIRLQDSGSTKRKSAYIQSSLASFQQRYSTLVDETLKDLDLKSVAYAIMIYETFNRPAVARVVERLLHPVGYTRTFGVMQVTSPHVLSDEESVKMGVSKIATDYATQWDRVQNSAESSIIPEDFREDYKKSQALRATVGSYNPDSVYVEEVLTLQREIRDLLSQKKG